MNFFFPIAYKLGDRLYSILIGIQIGGLSAIAPERQSDLAQISIRALIAGSIACFMTACVAGILIEDQIKVMIFSLQIPVIILLHI